MPNNDLLVPETASPYDEKIYPFIKNADNSYSNVRSQINERGGIFYIEPTMGDTSKHFGGYSSLKGAEKAEKEMHKKLEEISQKKAEEKNKGLEYVAKFNPYTGGISYGFQKKKEKKQITYFDSDTGNYVTADEGTPIVRIKERARQKQYEQINEMQRTSQFKEGAKIAANTVADIIGDVGRLAYEFAHDPARFYTLLQDPETSAVLEMNVPELTEQEKAEKEKRSIELAKQSRLFKEKYTPQFEISPYTSDTTQILGNVAGSLIGMYTAAGMRVPTTLVTSMYGLNSGYAMLDYLLSKGVDWETARNRALLAGISETVLEKASLDTVLRMMKTPWRSPMRRLAIPAITEGGTEALQTAKDFYIQGEYNETLPVDIEQQVAYSLFGGAFGGVVGGNIAYSMSKRGVSSTLQNKYGISKGIADKAAEEVVLGFPEKTKEVFKPLTQKDIERGQQVIEQALEQGGAAADIYLDQKTAIKERMTKAGIDEKEAERVSDLFATYDATTWALLQDQKADISKEDFLKERTQKIENFPEIAVKVDEQGKITPESETLLDEARERVAIMEENGASENEIKSVLEEMGLKGLELDDEILYSFDGFTLEDTGLKRLDDIYPEYKGETIDINGTDETVYNSLKVDGKPVRIAKSKESLQNFYNWFGDSKIVDKNNHPLVVWHGSHSEFTTFARSNDIGFHFGTKGQARTMAGRSKTSNVKGYYLSIKNPLQVSFDFGDWEADYDFLLKLERDNILTGEEVYELNKQRVGDSYLGWRSKDAQLIRDYLYKKGGWDGIEYPNRFEGEGKSYIAFRQEQIKSIDNTGLYSWDKKDTLLSRDSGFDYAAGSYYNKVVSLYKGSSPKTLVHELSHDFFKSYFKLTEKYGLQDRNKAIYDMLGKKSSKEFGTAEWETLTEEFTKYMRTSEAPNLASRNLFERAKDWLIKTFYTMNKSEKVSPEIKEFFDNLVSSDVKGMDLTDLQMTPRSLKEVFKSIKEGNEVGLKGVRRKDLLALQKAMHAFTPRRARSLADEMRNDGMRIKADTELAKSLGYDAKKKLYEQPVFGKDGIDSMDSLDEYLVEKGLLGENRAETYEQTADRESQIKSIIDQADKIYTAEEQKIADRRNAIEVNAQKAAEIASEIIKDNDLGIKSLEDFNKYLDDAIRMARSVDAILVNKNALDFLFEGYENAQKENAKLQKELKNAKDVIGVRQQLTDYIRKLPLNAQHRLSLLDKVKQVKSGDDFTDVLGKINDSFKTMWEQEARKLLQKNINSIIKSTKPKDRRHQKYNYEYNKLFEEFRKINSMTKVQALNAFTEFAQQKLDSGEEYTEADKVKNMLLSYKANGLKDSSTELMKQLENALYELRNAAIEDRKSTLEAKAEKKQKQIDDMANYVNTSKKVGKINATALKFTNLYSNEAELFGKDWADAHQMETVELAQNIKVKQRIDEQIAEGKAIYNVTGDYDFAKLINEKSQKKFTLYGLNGKAEGSVKEISLMDIMDIYLTIKNKHNAEIYDYLYEQHDEEGNTLTHNIQDLLDNLSEADKRFADALQKKVQSWRDEENKIYVKLYGIDMPMHENYWMRSSEKAEKELMSISKFANMDMIPSFMKDRSSFPFVSPENVWVKFQQRVNDSTYMTNTFEKYKEQYDLIHTHKVKNAIRSKYDGQRYASLTDSLDDLSLNGTHETFDEVQNLTSQAIGNWVVSQIAVNQAVFVKQLGSFTNYAENMNLGDFVKYEAEFLMNPVKAIKFMRDFDKEFLDYRFSTGMQNEVLGKIMADAEKNLSKYGYTYQKYLDLITLPVRYGDVGAIYMGGYARVKQLLKDGKTLEEAREIFRFETQRSQQSGLKSSMAQFQKNRYAKILTAFKNTQLQYMRKLQDSYIQWRRGEISTAKAAKIWGNYMFVQSIIYQVLTNVFGYLRDDDDDKEMEWFKDVGMQIVTSPIAGVPLLGDMAQDIIRDKHYDLGIAGLGDVNKFLKQVKGIVKKYEEDDLDIKSVLKGAATIVQFAKPLPNNVINSILTD